MIDDDIKFSILQNTDIVEIIAEVVDLKKYGSNFKGLCPFHNEKTPSFNVMQDRGFYKCFGCGVSGDAISFMREYHGLSYVEALQELARRAGIVIPDEMNAYDKGQQTERDRVNATLKEANYFFSSSLKTTSAAAARDYLRKRDISDDSIKNFEIGYSRDSWDALMKHMGKKGFDKDLLDKAGLIVRNDQGKEYDRFRNRIMFPIHDYMGKVIGFGARTMEKNPKGAKYLNSPQTMVYDKSKVLYGLYQAKNEIRNKKSAIIVEGYADVISLHQFGFNTAVAASGTALTSEQLARLGKLCETVYLIFDADEAGQKATEKSLLLAVEQGFDVRIVRLPKGDDPDSILRDKGERLFREYLRDAIDFMDFKINLLKSRYDLNHPSEKGKAAREISKLINTIPDKLQHDEYYGKMLQLLNLTENQLGIIRSETIGRKTREYEAPRPEYDSSEAIPKSKSDELVTQISDINNLYNEESQIINYILTDKQAFAKLNDEYNFSVELFITDTGIRLICIISELYDINDNFVQVLINDPDIDDEAKDILTDLASSSDYTKVVNPSIMPSKNWKKHSNIDEERDEERMIRDLMNSLELKKCEMEIEHIQEVLKSTKDHGIIIDKMKRQIEIKAQIGEVLERMDKEKDQI